MSQDPLALLATLLQLPAPWKVTGYQIDPVAKTLHITLQWPPEYFPLCPVCNEQVPTHDHRAARYWQHLSCMGYRTELICKLPRARCPRHGVHSVKTPWADPSSRMTRDQESYCIQVLLACPTVTAAAELLELSYDTVHQVRQRAVQRGLLRRDCSQVQRLCIDDKNFLRGSSFVTILSALDQGRVLEVTPERTKQAAVNALSSLPESVRQQVTAVAQDMWDPYQRAVEQVLPQAAIVHDRFHIVKHLNDAVNKVRRAENAELKAKGDLTLSGQRFVFLKNPQNWSQKELDAFDAMQHMELKVSRAWRLKELFGQLYSYHSETWARKFFARWFVSATHSRLPLLSKVAWMIKNRLDNVVSYAEHRITNAVAEGLNSKIQSLKTAARGFRNFAHYRIAILFHCGGLQLAP